MRYWAVLVALALAVFGAFWLIQLLALGHPHSVQLRTGHVSQAYRYPYAT